MPPQSRLPETLRGRTAARLALDGQCRYDVALSSLAGRSSESRSMRRDKRPARLVSGPLALAEAEARIRTGVGGGGDRGIPLRSGRVGDASVGRRAARRAAGGRRQRGRLHVVPQVRFGGEGRVLEVGGGRLADQVRISPQMCAGALQYIAPPLAGVASAEGKFSIDLDECRIPLDFPERGSLAGRMTVHSVAIGPGPLVHQLATAVGLGGTAQLSRESTVPFRMVQGRVYHRDLQLVFNDAR